MKHFIIPDTQVRPGVPTEHLRAAGNYIVDKKPEVLICMGDFFEMHSLSMYDRGTAKGEGARYQDDLEAGQLAMIKLLKPIWDYNKHMARHKKKQYKPRMVYLIGNHEERILRAINQDPKLAGKLSMKDLGLEGFGWEVHPYQQVVEIDGILYSHNFVNMDSLKKNVIGGSINNKMNKIGQSFTMGHQQVLQFGQKPLNSGKTIHGLVAGAFYQHDEDYMGSQGNNHFRGCIMKTEVKDGNYCICVLSLEYLMEKWL